MLFVKLGKKNLLMEHPVGGAFANSEEYLLNKITVLEKANEELCAKLEFRESEVDFFRLEAMEKDAENVHLKERIKRLKPKNPKEVSKGGSEEERENEKSAKNENSAKNS